MKKSMGFVFLIIFCTFLTHISAPTALGEVELPEWSVGDKWEYKATEPNITANFTIEVLNATSVNIEGKVYDVYVVKTVLETATLEGTFTDTIDNYILRSNLATVRSNVTHSNPYTSPHTMVITYKPPKKDYDFPLAVGKTWTSDYTESLYEEGWGYFNFTKIVNHTVIEKESVTVEAGTFECYKIEIDEGLGNIVYNWYSPEVNNIVKTTGGTETMPLALELTSYSYEGEEEETNEVAVPYLLLLIPIIIVIIVLGVVLWRRRY